MDANDTFYTNLGRWVASRVNDDPKLDPKVVVDEVRDLEGGWFKLHPKCESPIEEMLAAHLVFKMDGYNQMKTMPQQAPDFGGMLQGQVEIGKSRVDFLVTLHANGRTDRVIIETDGHDFHEKTKDQARRDKSRDRRMTADGCTVLRFTGSEVFRDAGACADEVEDIISQRMADLFEGPRRRR